MLTFCVTEFWKQIPFNEPYRVILGEVRDRLYQTRERSRHLLANGYSDIPEDATFTNVEEVFSYNFVAISIRISHLFISLSSHLNNAISNYTGLASGSLSLSCHTCDFYPLISRNQRTVFNIPPNFLRYL